MFKRTNSHFSYTFLEDEEDHKLRLEGKTLKERLYRERNATYFCTPNGMKKGELVPLNNLIREQLQRGFIRTGKLNFDELEEIIEHARERNENIRLFERFCPTPADIAYDCADATIGIIDTVFAKIEKGNVRPEERREIELKLRELYEEGFELYALGREAFGELDDLSPSYRRYIDSVIKLEELEAYMRLAQRTQTHGFMVSAKSLDIHQSARREGEALFRGLLESGIFPSEDDFGSALFSYIQLLTMDLSDEERIDEARKALEELEHHYEEGDIADFKAKVQAALPQYLN